MQTDQPTRRGEPLWNSEQLASYLKCTKRHLFNLRKRGLPAIRLGGSVRFDFAQVTEWMHQNSTFPAQSQPNSSAPSEAL